MNAFLLHASFTLTLLTVLVTGQYQNEYQHYKVSPPNNQVISSSFPIYNENGSSSSRALKEDAIADSLIRRLIEGEEEEEDRSKPWGRVFGATILVNIATLSGVVFLAPAVSRHGCKIFTGHTSNKDTTSRSKKYMDLIVPAFAAGALLSTIVFLVLPEGLMALQRAFSEDHENDEVDHDDHEGHDHRFLEGEDNHEGELLVPAVWRFGAMLLFGFLLPVVFEALFPKKVPKDEELNSDDTGDVPDEEHGSDNNESKTIDYPLVLSILIGDFLHNFCDGVFIGVAYLGCSNSVAITIVLVTLYHEIAQEIADFFILTEHANLTVCQALSTNFLAGLSVVFGGLLTLAFEINDFAIGLVLSFTCGTYFYIAAVECMPRANAVVESLSDRLLTIVMFIVGAVPVGLALINHSHCDEHGH